MNIEFDKCFKKQFTKLSPIDKKRVKQALELFQESPYAPALKNHMLMWELKDMRSLSAGFDLRMIYREKDAWKTAYFLKVGTHNQVYGK